MKAPTESLDDILHRARSTGGVMKRLESPPCEWCWEVIAPATFAGRIRGVDEQINLLAEAGAGLLGAAAAWDAEVEDLRQDFTLGLAMARSRFKEHRVNRQMFQGIRLHNTGRASRYQQALAFEAAWQRVEPAWVFKPGLTLEVFRTRRLALNTREENYVEAVVDERYERAVLHELARELHGLNVQWYDVATATFDRNTVAGQLVRTIPTTYNPINRAGAEAEVSPELDGAAAL